MTLKSIEKLRYYAKTICCIDGDNINRFADEIEREIAVRYMELPSYKTIVISMPAKNGYRHVKLDIETFKEHFYVNHANYVSNVVFCKDCEYCNRNLWSEIKRGVPGLGDVCVRNFSVLPVGPYDYCSWGKRRDK